MRHVSSCFSRQAARLTIAAMLLPVYVHADVRILDQPASSFVTIQGAVNAAQPGDTLIATTGVYDAFTLTSKGLTLLAAPGAQCQVEGLVRIAGIPPGDSVIIDGFKFLGDVNSTAVELGFGLGAIRFHNCEIRGSDAVWDLSTYENDNGGHALRAVGAKDLAFLNCSLIGGNGTGQINSQSPQGGHGGDGLWAVNCKIALYDCNLLGGTGQTGEITGGDGGDGCHISGLGAFASGSLFSGGDGGWADGSFTGMGGHGGDGGTGLYVEANTAMRLLDNTYSAGIGGWSFGDPFGLDGSPSFYVGGPLLEGPGLRRSLTVSQSVVPDGTTIQLLAEGQPGDRFYLIHARRPHFEFSLHPPGIELVRIPHFLAFGTATLIGPSGTATIQIPTANLPLATWTSRHLQALVLRPDGHKALTGSIFLTTLDDDG